MFDTADQRHAISNDLFKEARRLFITNYVLAEFVPLTRGRGLRRENALQFARTLVSLPRLELVWVDRELHDEAMELLQKRLDKTYSLCDAVSFVVMRRHKLTDALTTDKHFKQEGFVRLLD